MIPVSLVMMVRNGADTIVRTLDNAGPYISEVCISDSGCDDNTFDLVASWCLKSEKKLHHRMFNHTSWPEIYTVDSPESFATAPWASKVEYSGQPLLKRWDLLRMATLRLASNPIVLMMDADDLFDRPEEIQGQAANLQKFGRDVLHTTYKILDEKTRFPVCQLMCWRMFNLAVTPVARSPIFSSSRNDLYEGLRWDGWTHELLRGYTRPSQAPGVIVTDMRDNKGTGARVPARALKVLWLQLQAEGEENVSARTLYYLGAEALQLDPEFARRYLNLFLSRTDGSREERSSACMMLGELQENAGEWDDAAKWFGRAYDECPVPDPLFSQARIAYKRGNVVGMDESEREVFLCVCIMAVQEGLALLREMGDRTAFRGPALERGSYIIAAEALSTLGRPGESSKMAAEGLAKYPDAVFLQQFIAA